jgi:CRISPR-associated protein Cas1
MRYEIVDGYGCQVLKHSERLVVRFPPTEEGRPKRELPVLHLDHLLIGVKGVFLSSDAIALCCERGIPVTVVDWRGRPVGRFASPALHGTAQVRRSQLEAYGTHRGTAFAKAVVVGKLLNQADNLRYELVQSSGRRLHGREAQ